MNRHWMRALGEQPAQTDWRNFRRDSTTFHYDNACAKPGREMILQSWADYGGKIDPAYKQALVESPIGNPYTHVLNGVETSVSCIEFAAMVSKLAPLLDEKPRVLEIGGGYGGLARAIATFWDLDYTIVDLPFVGKVSRRFLDEVGLSRINVITPEGLEGLGGVNLVIQTRGFMEMNQEELDFYFGWMYENLWPGGTFWTINRWQKHTTLADYPYDNRWHLVKVEEWNPSMGLVQLERTFAPSGENIQRALETFEKSRVRPRRGYPPRRKRG